MVQLTVDLDPVTRFEFAPTLGFLKPVDSDLAGLDALLGLTASKDKTLPLQELIKAECHRD